MSNLPNRKKAEVHSISGQRFREMLLIQDVEEVMFSVDSLTMLVW